MRDTNKYRYITAAIPYEAQLYDELVKDAAASGKSLADIIVLRLADYYRNSQPVRTVPAPAQRPAPRPPVAPTASRPQEMPTTRQAPAAQARAPYAASTPARTERPTTTPAPVPRMADEEIKEYDPSRAKNAAKAALAGFDAFGEDDEQ